MLFNPSAKIQAASSYRFKDLNMLPRDPRLDARFGRNAAGLDWASLRLISTASWAGIRDSSCRPSAERQMPRLLRLPARFGRNAAGLD
jgi:hypothetical protein